MDIDNEIVRWVEYSLCEELLDIYPKSKSHSITFNSFCERISESILSGELSKREKNILSVITYNVNRQYGLTVVEIGEICATFFMDKRWSKYTKAIELMKHVKWKY